MKKKIVFLYILKPNTPWKDGLWAALNVLEQDYDVVRVNMYGKSQGMDEEDLDRAANADVFLGWGSFNSLPLQYLVVVKSARGKTVKTGLCVGSTLPGPNALEYLDVIFYETEWHGKQIDFPNKYHAFGINTDIFYSQTSCTLWDYIGVGAFADWKRWHLMLEKKGRRLIVGNYQDSQESDQIVQKLLHGGIMLSDQVEPEQLAELYRASEVCYLPSELHGGGERSLLEARACEAQVEIENDNPKLKELLDGPLYDHHYYYQQLKKGIESVI